MILQDQQNKLKVSVIVPCFKQAQYLQEALNSVLEQTYTNWECIIVDDGSPDDTAFITVEFCKLDDRFKYLRKDNGGLSSARNAGIKISSGSLILPLDADDKIHPSYLKLAVNAFINNPNLDLVYCKAAFFGEKSGEWLLQPYSYQELLHNNIIFCSAVFKKHNFVQTNGYNENLKKGFEDWDLWIRMLNPESQVIQLTETLFFYRIKKNSMFQLLVEGDYHQTKWDVFLSCTAIYRKHMLPPGDLNMEIDRLNGIIKFYQQSKEYRLGRLLFSPIRKFRKLF
ncbi:MAG: glycosyltransferase family 2 protein [Sphingobacteriaceae bacterium]|nr:MAG: glycosyltransferase family 2 protein [Sphingobacteriaceae bacterium]